MNKKITDLNVVHQLQLQLLEYFDEFCKDNNLRYFLAGGTLLGAVRHKGFIPWDDDIDVAMPRNDYEKFITLCNKLDKDYKILSCELLNEHMIPFAKFVDVNYQNYNKSINGRYGIRIDVFPLDGLGNSYSSAIKISKKIVLFRKFHYFCFKKNIMSTLLNKLMIHKLFYFILKNIAIKNNFYDSKYVGSIVGGLRRLDEIFEYRVYSETMDMEFEGKIFKGMKYYDEYLTRMYGDYMKLPPKEKQVAEHNVEIYDMRGE